MFFFLLSPVSLLAGHFPLFVCLLSLLGCLIGYSLSSASAVLPTSFASYTPCARTEIFVNLLVDYLTSSENWMIIEKVPIYWSSAVQVNYKIL